MAVVAAAVPARTSPWSPLRHRVFATLFMAQFGSNVGTFFQAVAGAWLMGDLNTSPTLVALVQTATLLPPVILGLIAGALADIVDRRALLIGTQLWMTTCAGTLAALTMLDLVTPTGLLALTFAMGCGSALMSPAWQAIQPDLVPTEELGQAIALSSMTFNGARAIGPALAGGLVAAAGPGWAFVVNAASFLGVVAVLARWHPSKSAGNGPIEKLPGAVRAGFRYGRHAPVLRAVLVRGSVFALPAIAAQTLLPVVVRERLGLGSGGYGVLLGCFGLGAVSAAIVRPRLESAMSMDRLMFTTSFVVAGGLTLLGTSANRYVVGAALFVTGGGWTTGMVTTNIAAQRALPWWVRARGLGLYLLFTSGALALGSAVWGSLAAWSIPGAHLIAAGAIVVGSLTMFRWQLRPAFTIDVAPAEATNLLVTFEPPPDAGPVMITIAYRVPPPRQQQFVRLMEKVERDRRRRGALHWGLFRDLVDPDRFVEKFHVSSWAEHQRQHSRRTRTADALRDDVIALADGLPEVTRTVSAYAPGMLADPASA